MTDIKAKTSKCLGMLKGHEKDAKDAIDKVGDAVDKVLPDSVDSSIDKAKGAAKEVVENIDKSDK